MKIEQLLRLERWTRNKYKLANDNANKFEASIKERLAKGELESSMLLDIRMMQYYAGAAQAYDASLTVISLAVNNNLADSEKNCSTPNPTLGQRPIHCPLTK